MGPTEEFEREAWRCGYRRIVGVDEAGRGPLAGPVVAAAVILPVRCRLIGVDDSKQLSVSERDRLYAAIMDRAVGVGVGSSTAEEIDRINILEATRLAMRRALGELVPAPDYVLIDAVSLTGVAMPVRPIIKGDAGMAVADKMHKKAMDLITMARPSDANQGMIRATQSTMGVWWVWMTWGRNSRIRCRSAGRPRR